MYILRTRMYICIRLRVHAMYCCTINGGTTTNIMSHTYLSPSLAEVVLRGEIVRVCIPRDGPVQGLRHTLLQFAAAEKYQIRITMMLIYTVYDTIKSGPVQVRTAASQDRRVYRAGVRVEDKLVKTK